MDRSLVSLSKFVSLILRHEPERIGLTLDPQGWAGVEELLAAAARHGTALTREKLERIVAENEKQRFAFSDDGQRIRARQGHSVDVDLKLSAQAPPDILYHGTAMRFLESIRATGLEARSRQHVHLSRDEATAIQVGQRHGKPIVLKVRAGQMHAVGHEFYLSENQVWLTARVPPQFLDEFLNEI
jgi:putative RNA 2'-phosphotransferase